MFLNRLALATAVGMSVQRGSATRVVQLLPQLSMELGVTLLPEDVNDDQLPAGNSFTLTASASNRLFTGSTTVALE